MSQAIKGLAAIGGAVALGATAFLLASTGVGFAALPFLLSASAALGLGGIGMEIGAVASALSSNRGANITVRQVAGYRQIVYGTQRVGGTMIYLNTTGAKHDQVNYVIVITGHVIDSILNIYLDGRQVFFQQGSTGNHTRNGVNFGGSADGNNHTGPDGNQYNFGGLVYVEACYGDQTNQSNTTPGGGFNTGLQANDPVWGPSAQGTPYVAGCAYVYFKYVYDATMFPQPPEVRFTIRGKNDIWDPRTNTTGYTANAALVVNDILRGSKMLCGLEDDSANVAQLVAAANICAEQVPLAGGGTENRYDCHYHFDTSKGPGAAIAEMLPAMGGRLTRSGGEWCLWPAAWVGPTAQFNADALAGGFTWNATRDRRDLVNRLTGTYTAPNYPYNATTENGSSLYDANGFYDGTIQNNFGFAFQATSIPYYAQDLLHGYSANEYLLEDGGELLQRDMPLPCVLSIAQAQRLLKIALLRNRAQGAGTFLMFPVAFQMQQIDTFQMSMAEMGWDEKLLEVTKIGLGMAPGANEVLTPQVHVEACETSPSIYEWSVGEELGTYLTPVGSSQVPYMVGPPRNLTETSSAATAVIGLDGVAHPRILLSWDEPEDAQVVSIQVRCQGPVVAGQTLPDPVDRGTVSVQASSLLLGDVVSGQVYNLSLRSVRANGAKSAWVYLNGSTVSLILSTLGQTAVGVGSLTGIALSATQAEIICNPFTARYGTMAVAVLPNGYTLTGLAPSQLWYVYYVDPSYTGGSVTPIATQNRADFDGKPGYFLIDSLVTPAYSTPGAGGGGGGRLQPSSATDQGSVGTGNQSGAYDGDTTTAATIRGISSSGDSYGRCTFGGFPATPTSGTLTINLTGTLVATGSLTADCVGTVTAAVGSTSTLLFNDVPTNVPATLTLVLPSGTDASQVQVTFEVDSVANNRDSVPPPTGHTIATFAVSEIYIQL